MIENLSNVIDYIRGCAKEKARDDKFSYHYKLDYKTLAKGAIAALIHLKLIRDEDVVMYLNEFDRVYNLELEHLEKYIEKYQR